MYVYTISESPKIAITTVQSVLVILNIVGNSLVCVAILKNKDMRYALKQLHLSIKMRNSTKLSAFIRLNAAAFIKLLVFRCGVYSRTRFFFFGKIPFFMSLMRTITIIICRYNYVKEKHV